MYIKNLKFILEIMYNKSYYSNKTYILIYLVIPSQNVTPYLRMTAGNRIYMTEDSHENIRRELSPEYDGLLFAPETSE